MCTWELGNPLKPKQKKQEEKPCQQFQRLEKGAHEMKFILQILQRMKKCDFRHQF